MRYHGRGKWLTKSSIPPCYTIMWLIDLSGHRKVISHVRNLNVPNGTDRGGGLHTPIENRKHFWVFYFGWMIAITLMLILSYWIGYYDEIPSWILKKNKIYSICMIRIWGLSNIQGLSLLELCHQIHLLFSYFWAKITYV